MGKCTLLTGADDYDRTHSVSGSGPFPWNVITQEQKQRKGEGIMKKRWLAASLAALMALSVTACGGGKAAETTAAPAETKAEETRKKRQRKRRKIKPEALLFTPRTMQIR